MMENGFITSSRDFGHILVSYGASEIRNTKQLTIPVNPNKYMLLERKLRSNIHRDM